MTKKPPGVGIRLDQELDPRRCIDLARIAETSGFASLWFAENPFHRGILPAVSACAAMTERIDIGIGSINPYQRHPTQIAMDFAALDELAGGPSRLGTRPRVAAGSAPRVVPSPPPPPR